MGHLCNHDAASVLRSRNAKRPSWIALAHLSAENNRPNLALETIRAAVGADYQLVVAGRERVSPLLHV